jgi:hypothetical protein
VLLVEVVLDELSQVGFWLGPQPLLIVAENDVSPERNEIAGWGHANGFPGEEVWERTREFRFPFG